MRCLWERDTLPMERDMLPMERDTLPMERDMLPMDRNTLPLGEPLPLGGYSGGAAAGGFGAFGG